MANVLVRTRLVPALGVLLLALIFPRLSWVQSILLSPAFLATGIFATVAAVIALADRRERPGTGTSDASRQRHALRRLAFTTSSAWSAVQTRQSWEESPSPTWRIPIRHMDAPSLTARVHSLFDLIKIHFILPWHDRISPSPAFPNAVEVLIRQSLSRVIEHGEKVDWPEILVARIVPQVTAHLHHFRSVEHLATSTNATSSANLPLPLPRKSHPALANAAHAQGAGMSPTIEAHLRGLIKRMLVQVLPEQERTATVETIITEVMLGTILLPVFEMLCDSDFWNRQIDDRGGRYLREQKQVNKFLSALSTLQQPLVTPSPTRLTASPIIRRLPSASSVSVHSSSKHFDTFLKSIGKLKTLGEARRLKADVERELRNMSQEPSDQEDEKVARKRQRYRQRLERAKDQIDDRISVLSGPSPASMLMSPQPSAVSVSAKPHNRVDLYTVLSDPSSLAYFLEFMDRRSRSRLVQFWLTVEGFKDPLEAAGKDSAVETTLQPTVDELRASDNTTIAEDVSSLYLAYMSGGDQGAVSLQISSRHKSTIQCFAEKLAPGQVPTMGQVRQTKHAMFSAQRTVYEQMQEDDWPAFMRSELYLKTKSNLDSGFARRTVSSTTPFDLDKTPQVPSGPIPPTPKRQRTAPANLLKSPTVSSPPPRPKPRLVNGSFAPAPTTPEPTVSVAEPLFRRVPSDGPSSSGAPTRTGSQDLLEAASPPTGPALTRGSSHFDVLMSRDAPKERGPLFDDDHDDEMEEEEDIVQVQRMEAIQAALNDIIASDDLTASRMSDGRPNAPLSPALHHSKSPSNSMISLPAHEHHQYERMASKSVENLKERAANPKFISAPQSRQISGTGGDKPIIVERKSSSALSPAYEQPTRHLFYDDERPDEGLSDADERDDKDGKNLDDIVKLAEPGNLYLGSEINRLQDKLQELVKQEHLLETLIRQAELTGNQAELRILNRSISSVRRETRTCIFQKAQYEQQEEENRLDSHRTRVTVPRHIDTEVDGKQVVRYVVRVEQLNDDNTPHLHWDVLRRYNDFHEFDQSIREWPSASLDKATLQELRKRLPDLPGKKIVPVLSTSQLDSRRAGLERYMQALLSFSAVCETPQVRAFLSRNPGQDSQSASDVTASVANLSSLAPHNLVRSLYKTMATSLDDAMFGPSMLDLMYTSLSRQISDVTGMVNLGGEDLVGMLPQALKAGWATSAAIGANSSTTPTSTVSAQETAASAFTAPICDLCVELFDLKENKNNWLRRQAILVIIQQFLGSTIERKVRDSFRNAQQPDAIEKAVANLQDMLFPDGQRRPPSDVRTDHEKHETKIRASKKLAMLIPDVAANMIGRSNARRAARRVFGALQDTRLNQQIILCILDEILDVLFPPSR